MINRKEDRMTKFLSVSEAARRLGAKPQDISELLYRRLLGEDLCPIVAGRRLIPEEHLDAVRSMLQAHGRQVGGKGGAS